MTDQSDGLFPTSEDLFPSAESSTLFPNPFTEEAAPPVYGVGSLSSSPTNAILEMQKMLAGELGVPEELATPEAARESNEAGLAKLATVNPELAEQLTAQMTGEGDAPGIWDQVKDMAGGALQLGGKVLDIMSRPARIIPELIVDEDNDEWWEDVGQALSGESKASGADVMRKWGVENDVAEGALGFAFDVAADPLSWMTFGGAGIGRAVLTKAIGTQVAEGLLKESIEVAAKRGAVSLLDETSGDLSRRLIQNALGSGFSKDFAHGMTGLTVNGLEEAAVKEALASGSEVMKLVARRQVLKKGIVDERVLNILKSNRALGGRTGKVAAGAMGGVRLRAFSYISPALPGTESLGFGRAAMMFNGQMGMTRLTKMARVGEQIPGVPAGMATAEDLDVFARDGWNGLQESNPKLYDHLRGAGGIPGGSMMYSLSSQVGKLTENFTPHARMLRSGGMVDLMAKEGNEAANDKVQNFIFQNAYRLNDDNGKVILSERAVQAQMAAASKDITDEQMFGMRTFLDGVPPEMIDDVEGGLEAYRAADLEDTRLRQEKGILDADEAAKATEAVEARVSRIKDSYEKMNGAQRTFANTYVKLKRQTHEYATRMGVNLGDVTSTKNRSGVLIPAQAAEVSNMGHRAARGVYTYTPEGAEVTSLNKTGFGDQQMRSTGGMGRGIVLQSGRVEDGVQGAVRLDNPLVIDEGVNAVTEQEVLDDLYNKANETIDMMPNKRRQAIDPDDWDEYRQNTVDEMVTERLMADGRDGIVRIDAEGNKTLVAFDTNKAKVAHADAPVVRETQGHYSRIGTPEFQQWQNGVVGEDATLERIFKQERARAHLDKGIDDAEKFTKKGLHDQLGELIEGASGPAKVQLQKAKADLDSIDIFNRNPLDEIYRYQEDAAQAIADQQLGITARKIHRLGDANGAGGAVRTSEYQWVDDATTLSKSKDIVTKTVRAKKDKALVSKQVTNQLAKVAALRADEFARLRAQVDDTRQVRAGRSTGRALMDHVAKARNERKELMALKAKVQKFVDDWENAPKRADDPTPRRVKTGVETDEALRGAGFPTLDELDEMLADNDSYIRDFMHAAKGKESPLPSLLSARKMEAENKAKAAWTKQSVASANASRKLGKSEQQLAALDAQMARATNEINRLQTEYRTVQQDIIPALKEVKPSEAGGLRGWEQLTVRGMENYYMPSSLAKELNSALATKNLGKVNAEWRRFQNVWKRAATIFYPGFHIRNGVGAYFVNVMGGVGASDYGDVLKIMGKNSDEVIPEDRLRKLGIKYLFHDLDRAVTWKDIDNLASSAGIRGGNNQVLEAMDDTIAQMKTQGTGVRNKKNLVPRFYRDVMANLMTTTEDFHRTAAFLKGLETSGGDVYAARQFTMIRHGNYSDLTDFEHGTVKSLVPFYKWVRTNVPNQFHQLLENPAVQLAAGKAQTAAYEVQGMDPDAERLKMPEYMREKLNIPVPWTKDHNGAMQVMTLDLPLTDLHKGLNEYVSSFLPTVRPFVESLVTEKSFQSGVPISGKMIPLAGWANNPGIRDFLTMSGIADAKGGEVFMSDKWDNALSVVPLYAKTKDWIKADPDRTKNRMNLLMSAGFGMGMTPLDDENLTDVERSFYYSQIEPAITHMQDMGWVFPDKDAVSASAYTALGLTPPVEETT